MYLPQCRTYNPETYNPNACGSDAYMESKRLWTRTLGKYTRAGLPEYVVNTQIYSTIYLWVNTMSGPPRRQHRTELKGHTPSPRI